MGAKSLVQIISHISDLHIPITKSPKYSELFNKRIIGYINHHSKRKNLHKKENLKLVIEDIHSKKTKHTLITGDLVNLSLESEFINASNFLNESFPQNNYSIVPGNHDAYVKIDYKKSLRHFEVGQDKINLQTSNSPFPFLKIIDRIAIIGFSTAIQSPPFMCWGKISKEQIELFDQLLDSIDQNDYFKIIMLHHPLHQFGWMNMKGLLNKDNIVDKILNRGANLIIHGHLHREVINFIEYNKTSIPCIGAPSSSRIIDGALSYLQYHIRKIDDTWTLKVYRRNYNFNTNSFEQTEISI